MILMFVQCMIIKWVLHIGELHVSIVCLLHVSIACLNRMCQLCVSIANLLHGSICSAKNAIMQ
jgi:hypothetical protein